MALHPGGTQRAEQVWAWPGGAEFRVLGAREPGEGMLKAAAQGWYSLREDRDPGHLELARLTHILHVDVGLGAGLHELDSIVKGQL